MRILAIETSCDETAIALVAAQGNLGRASLRKGREAKSGFRKPQFRVFKNLVASQIKVHQPFGGVVPNLAKREHLKNLPLLFKKIQNTKLQDADMIAVTVGPGLEPALWTGINFAKDLAKKWNKPIKGINHLEGHLYSNVLNFKIPILYPAISLIASGGHTILVLMKDFMNYRKLGETRDDAAGECFDKVARLLKLPYPGGPEIEKLAQKGNPAAINFPRPMINQKNYDFSFSGLKTAVLYYLRDNKKVKIRDVAASFQAAVFGVLIDKTLKAVKEFKAKTVLLSGGVASNKTLHREFRKALKKNRLDCAFLAPNPSFCTDNAAMIAAAGYINYLRNKNHKLSAQGNLNI